MSLLLDAFEFGSTGGETRISFTLRTTTPEERERVKERLAALLEGAVWSRGKGTDVAKGDPNRRRSR